MYCTCTYLCRYYIVSVASGIEVRINLHDSSPPLGKRRWKASSIIDQSANSSKLPRPAHISSFFQSIYLGRSILGDRTTYRFLKQQKQEFQKGVKEISLPSTPKPYAIVGFLPGGPLTFLFFFFPVFPLRFLLPFYCRLYSLRKPGRLRIWRFALSLRIRTSWVPTPLPLVHLPGPLFCLDASPDGTVIFFNLAPVANWTRRGEYFSFLAFVKPYTESVCLRPWRIRMLWWRWVRRRIFIGV